MPNSIIPSVDFAIVCGSANWGLSFPEDLDVQGVTVRQRDMIFSTPWGETEEWKLIEIDPTLTADGSSRRVLVVWSHGWPLDRIDHGAQRRVLRASQRVRPHYRREGGCGVRVSCVFASVGLVSG